MKLHGNMIQDENGLISIAGVDVNTLKATYGTPLYIFDEKLFEDTIKMYKNNFKHTKIEGIVAYASKALLNLEIAKIINQNNLSIDVVSQGELYTVYKAGFDMTKVYFHGNNKTEEELKLAIELNCGNIILDNEYEYKVLDRLLKENNKTMNIYLRVNAIIETDTHQKVQTATSDSKFGLGLNELATLDLIKELAQNESFNLLGLHSHIGSQINQTSPFFKNVSQLLKYYSFLKSINIKLKSINIGGGFGVYYTQEDEPMHLPTFLKALIEGVYTLSTDYELNLESVIIEPGRSMVANAGSTLYTAGTSKKVKGKEYLFVDGGMSDNPRFALYNSKYDALIANHNKGKVKEYSIAGKLCESGDVLTENTLLHEPKPNDLVLVLSTGAYNYSMSSNYNMMTRPALVFVKEAEHRLVVRRQTLDDLLLGETAL